MVHGPAPWLQPVLARMPLATNRTFCIHATAVDTLRTSSWDYLPNRVQGFPEVSVSVRCRHLAALPLPPRVGKMLLYGILFEVLDPILTVACCMAYRYTALHSGSRVGNMCGRICSLKQC